VLPEDEVLQELQGWNHTAEMLQEGEHHRRDWEEPGQVFVEQVLGVLASKDEERRRSVGQLAWREALLGVALGVSQPHTVELEEHV